MILRTGQSRTRAIISISTAMSNGSSAIPTTVRLPAGVTVPTDVTVRAPVTQLT